MKIAVIGDRAAITGFHLAGVRTGRLVTDRESAKNAFAECTSREDIGILLVTEAVADMVPEEMHKLRSDRRIFPILVEIPNASGTKPGRTDYVQQLIRRAIGVDTFGSDE